MVSSKDKLIEEVMKSIIELEVAKLNEQRPRDMPEKIVKIIEGYFSDAEGDYEVEK